MKDESYYAGIRAALDAVCKDDRGVCLTCREAKRKIGLLLEPMFKVGQVVYDRKWRVYTQIERIDRSAATTVYWGKNGYSYTEDQLVPLTALEKGDS